LRSRLDGSLEQATVGDVLRGKSGALPDLVHTHPSETVRDAIGILREYGVSQMPVVGAEPPVMGGEGATRMRRCDGGRRRQTGGCADPSRPAGIPERRQYPPIAPQIRPATWI